MKVTEIKHGVSGREPQYVFGVEAARAAAGFHKSIVGYRETPLIKLDNLARYLGVKEIYVKDESKRFGLNAFKGLGGSFAMDRIAKKEKGKKLVFITATDGNHGRGVAWAASRLGYEAHVLLPKGTAHERLENIQKLGAHAEITDLSYDDTVRLAAGIAEEKGWILLQDTAWEGYEDVPGLIMQGYTTMGLEAVEKLNGVVPTHIFLQAGVGSMAAAMASFFAEYYGEKRPQVIIVEPEGADCIYRTAEADDGKIHSYEGELKSIMAGLCCGEPCTIAWDILKEEADWCISCEDRTAETGMRVLGNPTGSDERIVSGESGASTTGAVVEILALEENSSIKEKLCLGENSIILCISTEGDTDRENYRKIVWGV